MFLKHNVILINFFIHLDFMVLVGGTTPNSGNVFAKNPTTGYYGPVCDDDFGNEEVRIILP